MISKGQSTAARRKGYTQELLAIGTCYKLDNICLRMTQMDYCYHPITCCDHAVVGRLTQNMLRRPQWEHYRAQSRSYSRIGLPKVKVAESQSVDVGG